MTAGKRALLHTSYFFVSFVVKKGSNRSRFGSEVLEKRQKGVNYPSLCPRCSLWWRKEERCAEHTLPALAEAVSGSFSSM
jgi:hypothetical protein